MLNLIKTVVIASVIGLVTGLAGERAADILTWLSQFVG